MSTRPAELVPGLWRWVARHPEWHPGEFGAEVASFAVRADGAGLLIDPLLPPDPEPVLELVDGLADADPVAILITIPYHVRSAEELRRRLGKRATIHGHPAAAKRLKKRAGFTPIEPPEELPGGARALPIGKPRRNETPFHLASHDAIAFGDAVCEHGGRLRVWATGPVDEKRVRFHRERFNPTLEPLLELGATRILVTHGQPVLQEGTKRLRSALRAKPWYHR
ncbi:MAG TPA: hypothetical protein VK307_05830 [Thermoleophilaceae bacterium]|nr:hypothetical protein [Thermoleophilaceae bacterium]